LPVILLSTGDGQVYEIVNIRRTYHLLIFGAFPVGAIGLSFLAVIDNALVLVVVAYAGLVALLAWRLCCPKCGERVMMQSFTILGYRIQMSCAYIRRYCDNCGHDLSGRGKAPLPAGRESEQKTISPVLVIDRNMPLLFRTIAVAGLVVGAMQLLFALIGLGELFILPPVRESPLAGSLVGLNGALAIVLALAIVKRYRHGLVLYFLYMGYASALVLYSLSNAEWHAHMPNRTFTIVTYVCLAVFLLIYGYVNRGWFRAGERNRGE
jgi:hypothetical protein